MTSFFALPAVVSSLILALFFVSVCIGGCLIFATYRRRNLLAKLLVTIGTLACGAVMLFYNAAIRTIRMGLEPYAPAQWLAALPVLPFLALLAVVFAYQLYVIRKGWAYRKATLSRSAIKEGVEKVSSGLCFFYDGGRIVLMNGKINALCHTIVGRDLQNAELFWEILCSGEPLPSVTRLEESSKPTFRLPDGSVWVFDKVVLQGFHQLIATDVTQLQAMTDELEVKNLQLASLIVRLKKHGENVDELTRSRERLEIKSQIHRELGQVLLASRRYLSDDGDVPLAQWQRNIAMLRKEAQPMQDETPMAMLMRAAKATGIEIKMAGQLPKNEEVLQLFIQAAAENLTNAISHAGAKTLFITFTQDEYSYIAQFRNDGEKPRDKIVEGGGLSSLRRKLEREGGQMVIDSLPEFILTALLPKERGENL